MPFFSYLSCCRGEAAFCSLECRERHITQEEWKDKCAVKSANSKDAAAGAAETEASQLHIAVATHHE